LKAISIVAPGGQLIAAGKKTLEIRKWYPEILPDEDLLIVENHRYLLAEGDEDIGYAVAVVKVKTVRPFIEQDIAAACASYFEVGWLAWELSDVRIIAKPQQAKAKRKIYQVDWIWTDKTDA